MESLANWTIALLTFSTSPAGIKKPFSPSQITAGTPPTREAMTGKPHAMASSSDNGNPSCKDGSANMSAP